MADAKEYISRPDELGNIHISEEVLAVIAAAATYFKSSSMEYLLSPAVFCMLGYFNGQERTTFVMIQGLASAFLVRVPLSWLFSIVPGAGLFTIGMAVPLSALFNLAVCLWYDRRLKKAG